jgi:hypothetical protein
MHTVSKTPRQVLLLNRRQVMERRKFAGEFQPEAVKPIKDRGASYVRAVFS